MQDSSRLQSVCSFDNNYSRAWVYLFLKIEIMNENNTLRATTTTNVFYLILVKITPNFFFSGSNKHMVWLKFFSFEEKFLSCLAFLIYSNASTVWMSTSRVEFFFVYLFHSFSSSLLARMLNAGSCFPPLILFTLRVKSVFYHRRSRSNISFFGHLRDITRH